MRHLTQTNHHLSVQGAFFQIECNKESLMDSKIVVFRIQSTSFHLPHFLNMLKKNQTVERCFLGNSG